jgi:hypothetical protein
MPLSRRHSIKLIEARIKAEARKLAGSATDIEHRFLSVALEKGKDLEPSGRLAGSSATSDSGY